MTWSWVRSSARPGPLRLSWQPPFGSNIDLHTHILSLSLTHAHTHSLSHTRTLSLTLSVCNISSLSRSVFLRSVSYFSISLSFCFLPILSVFLSVLVGVSSLSLSDQFRLSLIVLFQKALPPIFYTSRYTLPRLIQKHILLT